MKAQHTPAPWRFDYDGWCIEAENFENQKLIAAAPQLLEGANAALSLLAIHGQRETPTFEALLSAIRAAKGE